MNHQPSDEPKGHFAHFNALGRMLPQLSASELKVAYVLLQHRGKEDTTFVGVELIAELTGMTQRNDERNLAKLNKRGLLKTVAHGRGPGRRTVRQILYANPALCAGVSDAVNPAPCAGVSTAADPAPCAGVSDAVNPAPCAGVSNAANPAPSPPKPRRNGKQSPAQTDPKHRCPAPGEQNGTGKNSDSNSDVADNLRSGIREVLRAEGINEPALTTAADVPGLTSAAVGLLIIKATSAGKGTGWIVDVITKYREFETGQLAPKAVADLAGKYCLTEIAGRMVNAAKLTYNENGIYLDGRLAVPASELTCESIRLHPR